MFLEGLPRDVIAFVDEAYYEFVDADDYPKTLPLIDKHPLIVTRTFSKAYGLAGLRIGYGIAQPDIIAAMDTVREPFNVNSLAQAAAVAALDDSAFLARTRKTADEGKRYLTQALDALGVTYVPSAANFILLELGPRAVEIAEALLRRGVIVREMSGWKLPGCLRVTIGTPPENRRFLQEFKRRLS